MKAQSLRFKVFLNKVKNLKYKKSFKSWVIGLGADFSGPSVIHQAVSIIIVYLVMNPDEMFHIGDRVKVGYDGKIKDKAPIGIITLTMELVW
ncbi:hypothetical protein ACVWXS_000816 [Lysinibacillus sp. TE18511]